MDKEQYKAFGCAQRIRTHVKDALHNLGVDVKYAYRSNRSTRGELQVLLLYDPEKQLACMSFFPQTNNGFPTGLPDEIVFSLEPHLIYLKHVEDTLAAALITSYSQMSLEAHLKYILEEMGGPENVVLHESGTLAPSWAVTIDYLPYGIARRADLDNRRFDFPLVKKLVQNMIDGWV